MHYKLCLVSKKKKKKIGWREESKIIILPRSNKVAYECTITVHITDKEHNKHAYTPSQSCHLQELWGSSPGLNHILGAVWVCLCFTFPVVCLDPNSEVGGFLLSIRRYKVFSKVTQKTDILPEKIAQQKQLHNKVMQRSSPRQSINHTRRYLLPKGNERAKGNKVKYYVIDYTDIYISGAVWQLSLVCCVRKNRTNNQILNWLVKPFKVFAEICSGYTALLGFQPCLSVWRNPVKKIIKM